MDGGIFSFTVLRTSKMCGMVNKCLNNEPRLEALKNEAARQRWDLFHRAIAYAKQSNAEAMVDGDKQQQAATPEKATVRPEPQLSIAR
jgi:hypothetical protein